jgi:hypothetical protein
MSTTVFKRKLSEVYLILVPILASAVGLGIGHVSYKIYLPVWIINVCLMAAATWVLASPGLRSGDLEKKHIVAGAVLLILPWMFISMIGGMGPPPFGQPQIWLSLVTEQEVRYIILIVAAVSAAFGFAVLREKLKTTRGNLYSKIGFTALQMAMIIFILDMIFLGWYVEEVYRIMATSSLTHSPEWARPMNNQSRILPLVQDSLAFIGTAAFASALKLAGWFKPAACNTYIAFCLLGIIFNLLPPSLPEPLATLSFIATIPAVLFLMPYFMAINLLKVVAKQPTSRPSDAIPECFVHNS